ncbi:hypothetical protein BB559_006206 [Furculomyces boomerangus]|uniref:C2 domain-containing protein n=1 Tax=Furculomyces boomerangus TaxID=61424 RepID=A0A2T9Y468_9FUNG|nr:hypothetical protein BB559_006206 [Furculomyces boomerangus]
MPSLLKIKVLRARNLPPMDRKSSLADAYVEIRFSEVESLRTNICKKTLNPVWNEDFRIEVSDDSYLQNEPLELRVVDYDQITADDLIGNVIIDLNVLLMKVFENKNPENKLLKDKSSFNSNKFNVENSKHQRKLSAALFKKNKSKKFVIGSKEKKLNSNAKTDPENSSGSNERFNRIMDNTNTSSDDSSVQSFIGETEVVSAERENGRSIGGWFPIYDSQNGIRGELQCQIKIEFFGDVNPFRESSAGISIFSMEQIPASNNPKIQICDFVSTIITKSDPEYHWSDSFRTQRASNESRQRLMYQLSGQLRRKMGRKAIECGANMILGYKNMFDFEEKNKTITARAVGTAVFMDLSGALDLDWNKQNLASNQYVPILGENEDGGNKNTNIDKPSKLNENTVDKLVPDQTNITLGKNQSLKSNPKNKYLYENSEKNSEYDTPEKENSDEDNLEPFNKRKDSFKKTTKKEQQDIITLKKLPTSVITRLGGTVMAHSVKVVENDEEKTREMWWEELRREIKSHAKALDCSHIIGYSENTSIYGDAIVLSVIGTAAVLDTKVLEAGPVVKQYNINSRSKRLSHSNPNSKVYSKRTSIFEKHEKGDSNSNNENKFESDMHYSTSEIADEGLNISAKRSSRASEFKPEYKSLPRFHKRKQRAFSTFANFFTKLERKSKPLGCRMCHSPRNHKSLPYPMRFFRCGFCQKRAVPEIMLSTIEPPNELDIIEGEATIVEAHICRSRVRNSVAGVGKSGEKGGGLFMDTLGKLGINGPGADTGGGVASSGSDEAYAAFVGDVLPFIQYDLHRQLLYKLSVYGMNAVFGLKYHLSLGEDMIIATATGTAVYVTSLPTPGPLVILRNIGVWDDEDRGFLNIQNRITSLSIENRRRLDRKFRKKKRYLRRKMALLEEYNSMKKFPDSLETKDRTKSLGNFSFNVAGATSESYSSGSHDDKEIKSKENEKQINETSENKNSEIKSDINQATSEKDFKGSFYSNTGYSEGSDGLDIIDKASSKHNRMKKSKKKTETCVDCGGKVSSRYCISCGSRQRSKNQSIQASVSVQIDDDADEDLMAALFDHPMNTSFSIVNTEGTSFYRPPLTLYSQKNKKEIPEKQSILKIQSFKKSNEDQKNSKNRSQSVISNSAKNLLANPLGLNKSVDEVSLSDHYSNSELFSNQNPSKKTNQKDVQGKAKRFHKSQKRSRNKNNLTPIHPSFVQSIFLAKRVTLDPKSKHPNKLLANLFNQTYQEICANLFYFSRCLISAVNYKITTVDESSNEVQLLLTATAVGTCRFPVNLMIPAHIKDKTLGESSRPESNKLTSASENGAVQFIDVKEEKETINSDCSAKSGLKFESENKNHKSVDSLDGSSNIVFSENNVIDGQQKNQDNLVIEFLPTEEKSPQKSKTNLEVHQESIYSENSNFLSMDSQSYYNSKIPKSTSYLMSETIELTSLSYLPGYSIKSLMGRLNLHFVKEVSIESYTKGPIGMSAFVLSFINDVYSSMRAQIDALHGNALVCMSIDHQQFINSDKSNAYAMLSVSGDVVFADRLSI